MAAPDMSDLTRLVQFSGHYCNFEGHPKQSLLAKLQLLRFVLMVIGNPFSLASLFIGGLKSSMGIEVFFGLMGFLTALQHTYVFVHQKEIGDIIRSMKVFREKYQPGSDDEFQENTSISWKVVRMYFFNMTCLLFGYIMSPKFVDLAYGAIWDDPLVHFRVPLSMDAYLLPDQTRDMRYLVVSVFCLLWCAICTYSHFGLDSFLFLVGFYYSSIVKTFCSQLKVDHNLYNSDSTRHIKYVASQLRDLHLMALKMRDLFGFPYALQNLFGSFCNVSLLYVLCSNDSGGLTMLVANLFNFMLLTAVLCTTAYVGQHVTDASIAIFESLYNMPWYDLRPADRKYFITMLCATREPFTIHYHGRAPLSFAYYMAIMNTSYSYFMFMKSML